jgi:hypothetical protein
VGTTPAMGWTGRVLAGQSPAGRSWAYLGSVKSQNCSLLRCQDTKRACLVREHFIHSLLFQNSVTAAGMHTIIQQGCDDLAVFCWLCETASSAGIEGRLDVCRVFCPERSFIQVAILSHTERSVWCTSMHPSEVFLHVIGWEHVDIFESHRLEDILLEVVIEAHTGCAFHELTGPASPCQCCPLHTILAFLTSQY